MTRAQFIAVVEDVTEEPLAALQARGYDVVPCTCADRCCPTWQLAKVR